MRLFTPGAIVEENGCHRFGVLRVEKTDKEMSRYTLISCVNGAVYRNMPHYTMKLIKRSSAKAKDLVRRTIENLKESGEWDE